MEVVVTKLYNHSFLSYMRFSSLQEFFRFASCGACVTLELRPNKRFRQAARLMEEYGIDAELATKISQAEYEVTLDEEIM